MNARASTSVVFAAALILSACGDDGNQVKRPPPRPTPGAAAGSGAVAPPPVNTAPVIDPDYDRLMKEIVANCEITASGCSVTKCANDELNQLTKLWTEQGKKKTEALDVLAVMAADADPITATAATNVMSQRFGGTLNPEPGPVSVATSGRLIDAVGKLTGCHANQAARTTTHAAMLAKDDERLFEMLAAHPSEYVKINAFTVLMHHGRIRPLAAMKQLAKTASAKELKALLRAPRRMPDPTAEERATACPWAQTFLDHEDASVAYEAAFTMATCGGEYIDALLAEGEKHLEAGTLAPPLSNVFREPCAQLISKTRTDTQQAQCEKVYVFLEKVAKNKKLDGAVRGQALWNIYYQERTQATYDRLRKYARSRDKAIAAKVADALSSLEKTYGAKKL